MNGPTPQEKADGAPVEGATRPPIAGAISPALRRIANLVCEALFPARCCSCGVFLASAAGASSEAGLGAGGNTRPFLRGILCASCRDGIALTASPLCPVCGRMFKSRLGADHLCHDCMQRPRSYRRARAAVPYNAVLRRLIHAFKYGRKTRLAEPLGALLQDAFRRYWRDGDVDLAVPVPLHRRRFRQRGFNQAYLLMFPGRQPSGGRWPVPVGRKVLTRVRSTPSQAGLSRADRWKNIRGAFRVPSAAAVRDKRILLVDDVFTTGATVEACSRVLIQGGAARVEVLTVARAMPPDLF